MLLKSLKILINSLDEAQVGHFVWSATRLVTGALTQSELMWRTNIFRIRSPTIVLHAKDLSEPKWVFKIIRGSTLSGETTWISYSHRVYWNVYLWTKTVSTKTGVDQNHRLISPLKILNLFNLSGKSIIEKPEDFHQFIGRNSSGCFCTICHTFSHRSSTNVKNHVESKHFPNSFTYTCPMCQMSFGSKKSLENHKSLHHKQPKI